MNRWKMSGIDEIYKRTGVAFDKIYFESDTHTAGRGEIEDGIVGGAFYRQDTGNAIQRHEDVPLDRLIYVVGAEQEYHFSYGMVNLPAGRMKSREGTVVDADDP